VQDKNSDTESIMCRYQYYNSNVTKVTLGRMGIQQYYIDSCKHSVLSTFP